MKQLQAILRKIPVWCFVLIGGSIIATTLALTHPSGAIISFDEGFHGGAALYFDQVVRQKLGLTTLFLDPIYIQKEFSNGITLYPPLWTVVATKLSLIFGPSTTVYRAATSLFYIAAIMLAYWFVLKNTKQQLPAILTAGIIATIPMIAIYSHLMMLEVPLLVGITAMVTSFFLLAHGKIKRTWYSLVIIALTFLLAPLTKLPALPIAWLIIICYIIGSSILFWRSRLYRDFLKPEIIVFALLSFGAVYYTIQWIQSAFGVNMLEFFVGQTQAGVKENPLTQALELAWAKKHFYLRDFLHIPHLMVIWFGSLVGYMAWKRTPLSVFLLIWTLVTYAAFSGVQPQVPQYIMPLYAPLGIATALMIFDASEQLAKRMKGRANQLAIGITCVVVALQLIALPKSEAYGWRTKHTGQEEAVRVIAERAKFGDRIISWHDGDAYAIRVATLDKYMQIINGTTQTCPAAMRDSFEWALVVHEPPYISTIDDAVLKQSPWEVVGRYGADNSTVLYHNPAVSWPATLEAESTDPSRTVADDQASLGHALALTENQPQPAVWGCLRALPFGKSSADFYFKAEGLSKAIRDHESIARIEHNAAGKKELAGRTITAGELRQSDGYIPFRLDLEHNEINLAGEFVVKVYRPVTLKFDKVVITQNATE
jgi:hypothetical protein